MTCIVKTLSLILRTYFKFRYLSSALIIFFQFQCNYFIDTNNFPWKNDPYEKIVNKKFREMISTDKTIFKEYCENHVFVWEGRQISEDEALVRSAAISKNFKAGFYSGKGFRSGTYIFHNHAIYLVEDNGAISPSFVYIAIGVDSQIHPLWGLNSFNDIINKENLRIESDSIIFLLINSFLAYYLSDLEVQILTFQDNTIWDNNFSQNGKYIELKKIIKPPYVIKHENSFIAKFFSWSWQCGSVVEWKIAISSNGIFTILSKTLIDRKVGNFNPIRG